MPIAYICTDDTRILGYILFDATKIMEDSYHSFLLILSFTHCMLQCACADTGE